MLIASYFVARDDSGAPLCIAVEGVFLDGYEARESDLDIKADRTDLVQTFEQDGYLDGFILPDLPPDIVNLLGSGGSIEIVDLVASQHLLCTLTQHRNYVANG